MSIEPFLKRAGWKRLGTDWSAKGRRYRVVEESAPGSWDRSAAPYLAKAILQARAGVASAAEPVAVLTVKRATPLTDDRLAEFVRAVAPDQSWILSDSDGRIFPHVASAPELAQLAAKQPISSAGSVTGTRQQSLFTDLNQWMLKVLLAPLLPEKLLTAPRGRALRNASTLADAAEVSLPAASRFLQAVESEGQLDTRFGDLRIARPLELLKQWRDRTGHPARREVAAASVRGPFNLHILASVAREVSAAESKRPPLVLGLHAACSELGLGHVTGAVPVVWAESLDASTLEENGLVIDTTGQKTDLVLRVPRYPESLYRGVVQLDRSPVTDVLQCWLDTSHYRIRGEEQADFLWRTVLKPKLGS